MHQAIKNIIFFTLGAAVGALGMKYYLDKEIIRPLEEEITEIGKVVKNLKGRVEKLSETPKPEKVDEMAEYKNKVKVYKSLEEQQQLKESNMTKLNSAIISEMEYDRLVHDEKYDFQIFEANITKDPDGEKFVNFTWENGSVCDVNDLFDLNDIGDEEANQFLVDLHAACIEAPYEVGAFAVNFSKGMCYQIVPVIEDFDEEDVEIRDQAEIENDYHNDKPYFITEYRFENERPDFEKMDVTYHKFENSFTFDDSGAEVDDPEYTFPEFDMPEVGEVYFVRNENTERDYKILIGD